MPKWELVKAGDILWQKRRGNYGQVHVFEVRVISVDHAAGSAQVRWNSNRPTTWRKRDLVRLTRKKPKSKR